MSKTKKLAPIHPGEILREDFLAPFNLSVDRLALNLRVPATRMSEIIHERRAITADTTMRLGRYFGTTPEFWMNLQRDYDLAVAQDASAEMIRAEVQPIQNLPRTDCRRA